MKWKCLFFGIKDEWHDWDGCKCKQCGRTKNEEHDWDGCKCKRCGTEQHEWRPYGDSCVCIKCDKKDKHTWVEVGKSGYNTDKCTSRFGGDYDFEYVTQTDYRCVNCGETESRETGRF